MTREEVTALLTQPLYPLGTVAEREAYANQIFAELQEGRIAFVAIDVLMCELGRHDPRKVESADPDIPYSLVILMLRSENAAEVARQGLRGWLEYQARWVHEADIGTNTIDTSLLVLDHEELAMLTFPDVSHKDVSDWFVGAGHPLRVQFYLYRWELPLRLSQLVEPTGQGTYRWRAPLVVAGLGVDA